jgi:hypothetical protein
VCLATGSGDLEMVEEIFEEECPSGGGNRNRIANEAQVQLLAKYFDGAVQFTDEEIVTELNALRQPGALPKSAGNLSPFPLRASLCVDRK